MTQTLDQFKALRHAAAEALRSAQTFDIHKHVVQALWSKADSPIERAMGQAIACCEALNGGRPAIVVLNGQAHLTSGSLIVAPQYVLGSYRVDFALRFEGTRRQLVVECDGFEFHDRNIEQAAADKARDRFLLKSGWPVMRFTGSEITRQLDLCLADIVEFLTGGAHG